jgi:Ca-activated chloride channel family protein
MFGGGGSDLDERTLQAIAERTGARYFRADDTDALREVYATIDALEKIPAEVEEVVNAEERHHPFTFAALCLLGLSLLLSETALRRLP